MPVSGGTGSVSGRRCQTKLPDSWCRPAGRRTRGGPSPSSPAPSTASPWPPARTSNGQRSPSPGSGTTVSASTSQLWVKRPPAGPSSSRRAPGQAHSGTSPSSPGSTGQRCGSDPFSTQGIQGCSGGGTSRGASGCALGRGCQRTQQDRRNEDHTGVNRSRIRGEGGLRRPEPHAGGAGTVRVSDRPTHCSLRCGHCTFIGPRTPKTLLVRGGAFVKTGSLVRWVWGEC